MITQVTASGEEHGLINQLPNSVADNNFEHMTPDMKKKCEKTRKEEEKIVKARYMNHRGQHERLTKPYCRWAGDPIKIFHLIPGREYELPFGFIKEVNENKGLAQRSIEDDHNARLNLEAGQAEKLHELVPISFI